MTDPQQIVTEPWNYCNVLRDDGLSCGDCLEQLTVPFFLKMAHEQAEPPRDKASPIDLPGLRALRTLRASLTEPTETPVA